MKIFTKHPGDVGMTYCEHFFFAWSVGLPMILSGCKCLIHSVLPFLFTKSTSDEIKRLNRKLRERVLELQDWSI